MKNVNKVILNDDTLIDLTNDTVTETSLAEGVTAHDKSGNIITGTLPTSTVLYTEQQLEAEEQTQARANIGALAATAVNYVTPEMFGAKGDYWVEYYDEDLNKIKFKANENPHDDSDAFCEALRTGKRVVCDGSKVYYFAKPVDVRELYVGHLDGNNAYFVNFQIYININDGAIGDTPAKNGEKITSWRRRYGADRFIIENLNLGGKDSWTTRQPNWDRPCIITGCPTIIRNIVHRGYPYLAAIPGWDKDGNKNVYIDYMLFESIVGMGSWHLFEANPSEVPKLDAVCCLTANGEYKNFDEQDSFYDDNNNEITYTCKCAGDSWSVLRCQEYDRPYRSDIDYYFIHVNGKRPMLFEMCIQVDIAVASGGHVVFIGGHWEVSPVTLLSSWGTSITFINCYFWETHKFIDSPNVRYINCIFAQDYTGTHINDGPSGKIPLSFMTSNKSWTDLKCVLENCQFDHNNVIDTSTLQLHKKLPKNTYNGLAIKNGSLDNPLNKFICACNMKEDGTNQTHADYSFEDWRPYFFPVDGGTYEYTIYAMRTSDSNLANDKKVFTLENLGQRTNDKKNNKIGRCILHDVNGGYGFIIIRKHEENNVTKIFKSELYLDPALNVSNTTKLRFSDFGSYAEFVVHERNIQTQKLITPWIELSNEPNIPLHENLYEASGQIIEVSNPSDDIRVLKPYKVNISNVEEKVSPNLNNSSLETGLINVSDGTITTYPSTSYWRTKDFIDVRNANAREISVYATTAAGDDETNNVELVTTWASVAEYIETENGEMVFNEAALKDGDEGKKTFGKVQLLSDDNTQLYSLSLHRDTTHIKLFDWYDPKSALSVDNYINALLIAVYPKSSAVREFIAPGTIQSSTSTNLNITDSVLVDSNGVAYKLNIDTEGKLIATKMT